MKYTILIRPHHNRRYQEGVLRLSQAELINLLRRLHIDAPIALSREMGNDFLSFEAEALDAQAIALISRHSHLQLLLERREGGLLLPLAGERAAYLGADLAYVLKYKGKTNEAFTQHLIHQALLATDFDADAPLSLLDPMCGKGTTLFQAINCGYHAVGAELHPAEIEECGGFFKRYLELQRVKHTQKKQSITLNGKGVPVSEFTFAASPEAYKAGDTRTLRLITGDGMQLPGLLKKEKFHLIAADLPYGVQHAPGSQGKKTAPFAEVASGCIRAWSQMLIKGGAMALSFNVNTLPAEQVRAMMADAGLEVMTGAGYDGLSHWVEQAITRDAAVARRL